YLPSDFKKNKGYERSLQMCIEYDIYRQCYCGCVFAAKQQGCDLKVINREAKAYLKTSTVVFEENYRNLSEKRKKKIKNL
ncbi:epoxyqueuosine reductase QueH, partial [Enterococcus faecium]|uniref:epoxyqueuosine reductase QueH n=1 Tax=Enterococcus faecium TaxID=1352 RepID=UPI003CC65BCC